MKRKARKQAKPLTVKDYPWGCIYTGTKAQLIQSGLLKASDFRKHAGELFVTGKSGTTHECRLGTLYGEGLYELFVDYTVDEKNVAPQIESAIHNMRLAFETMISAVRKIQPAPLSVILGAPALMERNEWGGR